MPEVLLIGWDGAGWNQIHPLLDAGAMPNLARLVERGVMGQLATLTPLCSPLLWTSVATGQFADRHGILDPVEADPRTGGIRPVTRASLRSLHIWDILTLQGLRSQAVGWPATHGAAFYRGPSATCVSDGFVHGIAGSVRPPGLEARLIPLRFGPQEWTGAELQLFVPELARIDQDKDKRLARLAVLLAESVSVHAAATTLMETSKTEFTAVWLGTVGSACELFSSGTDEIYKDVVSGVYRFLDLFLGRLIALAGPEATVMLVSDRAASEPQSSTSTGCGPSGMLCAAGPGIQPDELTFGAGLLDIAPTILAIFGLAPTPGMPGQQIREICATVPVRRAGHAECATPPLANDDSELERELRELEAIGYTDTVATALQPEAAIARRRREFNLARVLAGQGRHAEAIAPLEGLAAEAPESIEVRLHLAHAYFQTRRYEECRAICETLLAQSPDSPFAPLARAHLAIAAGRYRDAAEHLDAGLQVEGLTAALDAAIGEAYLRAQYWEEAATAFRSAIRKDAGMAPAHQGLAQALFEKERYSEAAEAALDAIRLRYDFAAAHTLLGRALQKLGRSKAAAEALTFGEKLRDRIAAV
jgi:tetratricopeptide (TPR) repeat protein